MNFKNKLHKGYQVESGYYYKYQNGLIDNNYIEAEIGRGFKEMKGYTPYPESYYIELLCDYFLYRAFYSIEVSNNKKESLVELSRVNKYTNILIHLSSKCCRLKREDILLKYFFLNMQNIVPFITISLLSQEHEVTKILTEDVINSVNAKNCIIERGIPDAFSSWFTMEILSIYFNIDINKKVAYNPKKDDFIHYQNILDKWDTDEIIEVEKMIYSLIELHSLNTEKEKRKYESPLLYATTFFPYEILAWLKLRELKGLKNPKNFTHPLMNTPIAKMFLEIKEPLPKPKELPYAKKLLEKLKEKCPDVEIPAWLGGEKESEKETAPIPTIHLKSNQLAPKTGRYQATLNQDHPQAEFLKSSGFDVKKVQEGESIGTFGLSGEDEEDIVWVYLGE